LEYRFANGLDGIGFMTIDADGLGEPETVLGPLDLIAVFSTEQDLVGFVANLEAMA
jgi:hypothetical protein